MTDIEGTRLGVRSCSNLTADNLVALLVYDGSSTHLAWKCAVVLLNK